MTDAEMVKAMEICKDKEIPCDDCPLVECGDCEGISRQYFYDRFNELKVENAALRERLEKALELPCMAKLEIVDDNDKHLKYIFFIFYKENGKFSSIKYLNKEAAEARLKELKGEQNG